jgi:hypothetical protein
MMVKQGGKETEKEKLLNREARTSGSSSSGASKSSGGSAGRNEGSGGNDRLATVEKTLTVLMATIDQILLRLEKIDLGKMRGGGGALSSAATGPSEQNGGLHFPKSLSRLATTEAEDENAEEALKLLRADSDQPLAAGGKVIRRSGSFSDALGMTRQSSAEEEAKNDDDEPEKTVLVASDEWMINPTKKFRMTWDLCLIMPFLLYLTVMMPFRLCFANEARFGTGLYWWEFMIDLIFILDIVTNFRTGVFVGRDGDGDLVEYDRAIVAKQYLQTWCKGYPRARGSEA